MLVQPNIEMAAAVAKDRLPPMLREMPALRGLLAAPSSRNGTNEAPKGLPGGHIALVRAE